MSSGETSETVVQMSLSVNQSENEGSEEVKASIEIEKTMESEPSSIFCNFIPGLFCFNAGDILDPNAELPNNTEVERYKMRVHSEEEEMDLETIVFTKEQEVTTTTDTTSVHSELETLTASIILQSPDVSQVETQTDSTDSTDDEEIIVEPLQSNFHTNTFTNNQRDNHTDTPLVTQPPWQIEAQSDTRPVAGSTMPLLTSAQIAQLQLDHKTPYCAQVEASTFKLRIGPNYSYKKLKAPSAEAFMELVGMDFVRTLKGRLCNMGSHVRLPKEWIVNTGHSNIPSIFIMNVQVAEVYRTTMFGDPLDSPGVSFVFYFKMKQSTIDSLSNLETASPSLKLFADYCQHAPEAYSDILNNKVSRSSIKYYGRFKVILRCDNIKEPCMSWVPSIAVGYNEKPSLLTHSGTLLRGDNYIEMDCDTRIFGAMANYTIPGMLRNMHHSRNSVAFCIQSNTDDEMPETALGCAHLSQFSITADLPQWEPAAATTVAAVVPAVAAPILPVTTHT